MNHRSCVCVISFTHMLGEIVLYMIVHPNVRQIAGTGVMNHLMTNVNLQLA